jgi:hypothetical protein
MHFDEGDEAVQHEHGEGDDVQARQRRGEAFVVAHQPAEARLPGEAAFHDPATLPIRR